MKTDKSPLNYLAKLLFLTARSLMGLIIIKTGYDLLSHNHYFGYIGENNIATGIFVIAIGCYCIFSSIYGEVFKEQ